MVNPASSKTVEMMSGLETLGKGEVESRVEVIKVPSWTGRIGISWPVDGSMVVAISYRFCCTLMMVSMGSALRHAVSAELQFREEVNED